MTTEGTPTTSDETLKPTAPQSTSGENPVGDGVNHSVNTALLATSSTYRISLNPKFRAIHAVGLIEQLQRQAGTWQSIGDLDETKYRFFVPHITPSSDPEYAMTGGCDRDWYFPVMIDLDSEEVQNKSPAWNISGLSVISQIRALEWIFGKMVPAKVWPSVEIASTVDTIPPRKLNEKFYNFGIGDTLFSGTITLDKDIQSVSNPRIMTAEWSPVDSGTIAETYSIGPCIHVCGLNPNGFDTFGDIVIIFDVIDMQGNKVEIKTGAHILI